MQIKKTCLNKDCPERTGGECAAGEFDWGEIEEYYSSKGGAISFVFIKSHTVPVAEYQALEEKLEKVRLFCSAHKNKEWSDWILNNVLNK